MGKKTILVGAGILLVVGGYYWYNKSNTGTGTVQYKTTVVERGSLTTSISGSGNVVVDQLATVDPTITGTVSNVAVNVGDPVQKGTVLFTIINNDLSVSNAKSTASLQQSGNSVDAADLQIKQAKADYRAAKKDGSGATSDQKRILEDKIEIAESGLIATQKSYAASRADYNNQLVNGAKRTVTSPIDGTVSAINIKNGDDLSRLSSSSASSAPMIIGDLKTLKAQVAVNEVDIANVAIGQKVVITYSAIDGLTATGKVEKIDALGTLTQGVVSYGVTIGLDAIDPRIRPQMSVSAKIITQVKQDVVIVPNSALKTQQNATYLEVLNNKTQLPERRMIEIGAANNTETEIVSGVAVGEAVITQTIDPNVKATTPTSTGGGGGGVKIPGLGGRG